MDDFVKVVALEMLPGMQESTSKYERLRDDKRTDAEESIEAFPSVLMICRPI